MAPKRAASSGLFLDARSMRSRIGRTRAASESLHPNLYNLVSVKQERGHIAFPISVVRERFLDVVARLVPEVLQELRRDVLPQFQSLFRNGEFRTDKNQGETGYVIHAAGQSKLTTFAFIKWRGRDHAPRWESEFSSVAADPARAQIKRAVEGWGMKWNLTDEWIRDAALSTMLWWTQHPADTDFDWHHRSIFQGGEDLPPNLVINEPWLFEPWDDYVSRIQLKIDEYGHIIKDFYARTAYHPDPPGNNQRHIEWLVLYQVRGYSADDIARWYRDQGISYTIAAIAKGYQAAARLLGLTRRGRKKSYTKSTQPRRRSSK